MRSKNEAYAHGLCKKMKQIIRQSSSKSEQVTAVVTITGLLNGMRVTRFISRKTYNHLYDDMSRFLEKIV